MDEFTHYIHPPTEHGEFSVISCADFLGPWGKKDTAAHCHTGLLIEDSFLDS
jgi:hypothetical protein